MTNENVVEEIETPEETTPNIPEEETTQPAEVDPPETELPEEEEEEEIDWEARAKKAEEVANNYKKENEKYRKPKTERLNQTVQPQADTTDFEKDYLSKKEDVLEEYRVQIEDELSEEEWGKISNLVNPALDDLYYKSSKQGRYVAEGKLKSSLSDLIDYAKGNTTRKEELEKARLDGIKDKVALESAQISKTTTPPKDNKVRVSQSDKKYSETSGGEVSPERAKEIRESKAKRAKDYSTD